MTMPQQPTVKDDLKAAFAAAKKTATVEVYHADHGWCVQGRRGLQRRRSRTGLDGV